MHFPTLNLERVKTANESISAFDEQLNITLWNPAIEKRTGIAEKDAIGKSLFYLFPHIQNDQRVRFLSIAMMMDQPFYFPNMIYLYTQPFTYYTQYIHPLKLDNKIIGVLNIVRDHIMEESFSSDEFLVYFEKEKEFLSSLQNDKDRSYL
jgi:PAS domain-containing protein